MGSSFVTINPVATQALAVESSAPYVAELTEKVATHARLIAPGSMKSQIRAISTGGPAPLGIVVSDHPASLFVLQGTKAHKIQPKKPGGVLVFTPTGSSTKVYARVVNHPGTKANDFLSKALLMV